MKASELTGADLDYWVAIAEGAEDPANNGRACFHSGRYVCTRTTQRTFAPSMYWADGGPIIDRERMTFATTGTGPRGENGFEPVVAITYTGRRAMEGATHLIAAMRAYVANKFGDEVEAKELG